MPSRLQIFIAGLFSLLFAACGPGTQSLPIDETKPENTLGRCSDGEDNDGDDAIDCADPDCDPYCTAGPETDCSDDWDNDQDGKTDCRDPDCADDPFCVVTEDSLVECSDGLDNDFDEAIDCGDDDCMAQVICGPELGARACADLFDNDDDGSVDCADAECDDQPACAGGEVEGTDDSCSDDADNDGDSAFDCQDSDCRDAGVAGCAVTEAGSLCGDRLDNDGDGQIDCSDADCDGAAACVAGQQERTVSTCGNGLDDDADGYADCADLDCFNNPAVTFCGIEQGQHCADDIDNDGDTQIDCADEDCARACQPAEPENGAAACSDGEDNDGDQKTDCADNECQIEDFCVPEVTPGVCTDERDNDGDGAVDCVDSGCAALPICTPETDCDNALDDDTDGLVDCQDSDCFPGSACGRETASTYGFCNDARDNDNDGWVDCADPGCVGEPRCQTAPDELCGNLIDDDGDERLDCDDFDCLLDFAAAVCDEDHPSASSRRYTVHQLQNVTDQTFPPTKRGDWGDDPVRLRQVVVTFVDPDDSSLFYVADPGDTDCGLGLAYCYMGMRVQTDGGQASDLAAGQEVDLAGLFTEFAGESGLLALAWQTAGGPVSLPVAQDVEISDLNDPLPYNEKNNDRFATNPSTGAVIDPADDTRTAERYEGMLVTLTDVEVSAINAGDFTVTDPFAPEAGAVIVGSRWVRLDGPPSVGAPITSVTGILRYERTYAGLAWADEYRIEPRSEEDWDFPTGWIDSDSDGLTDDEERAVGTDPHHFDTDRDEYSDLVEVGDVSAPSDADGDGLNDALESFVLDRDGDDIPDELDAVNLDGPNDDRDGDGVLNADDPDDDNDGICDPGVDPDGTDECDTHDGAADNCPYAPEPRAGNFFRQQNQDQDLAAEMADLGILLGDQYDNSDAGDACDWDIDGDTHPNPFDNCPYHFNLDQADEDHDGFGDPCDAVPAGGSIQTTYTPFPCLLPEDGGRHGCDLIIEEVMYNLSSSGGAVVPDSNRDGAPSVSEDELVEIRNVSGVTLDLSGLELHDWASFLSGTAPARHRVPVGTILRHNQRLLVFGGGTPLHFPSGIVVQTASGGRLGLSNGADAVILFDPGAGAVVAILPYGDPTNGEPAAAKNVSLTRYPDGVQHWTDHPARTYGAGGQSFVLGASPGQAPDNQRPAP